MPFGTPAFTPLTSGDTDYIAEINANFDAVAGAFTGVSSVMQNADFLAGLLPLAAALGITLPPTGVLNALDITPLGMGTPASTYITDINADFAAVAAAFGNLSTVTEGTNTLAALGRFAAGVLGGRPCLVGNHSYFCSQGSDLIYTQPGYAWLPSIPAVVHNPTAVSQFLAGGNPNGEWWYMVIDKTGVPTWLVGETGDTVTIILGVPPNITRHKGTGLPSLPFFKVWVVLAPGKWLIFPPIQLLPIFQLTPSPPALTPLHP